MGTDYAMAGHARRSHRSHRAQPHRPASATTRTTTTATTVYVANYLSGTVTPINTATDRAGPPIYLPLGQPYVLAATPDGRTVYVVSVDNRPAPAQYYVTPIDTATRKPGTPIPVEGAGAMAMAPDGKTLYVFSYPGIVPIDTATNTPQTPNPLPSGARAFVISRDGRRAYAAGGQDFSQGTVTAINLVTGRLGRTICTGMDSHYGPVSLAITPTAPRSTPAAVTAQATSSCRSTPPPRPRARRSAPPGASST